MELDDVTYFEITKHSEIGDAFFYNGDFESALKEYNKAWELIPDPKNEWNASMWVLGMIGATCIRLHHLVSAKEALEFALHCPGGRENPYINLKLGELHYESGDEASAGAYFFAAQESTSHNVFVNEPKKYRLFYEKWLLAKRF